jgi:Bacterial PH domain
MSRARMKLESGERLLFAVRPHPALLIPALLRASGVLLAAALALALLLRSSAPDGVRIALDLPVIALAGRSVFRFARAVWQWDRALLALTTRRLFVASPRGRLRRAWETIPLGAIRAADVHHSFAGRLLGYGTVTLGPGANGRELRFVSAAERIADTILAASPHGGRTWTQIEGPAVSDQPAPRSRLA